MEVIEFEDSEVYDVEVSASGDNAYCIDLCSVVGHRPPYAACLKKIAERKHGRLASQYSECSAAIGKKECPAMKLRDKETAKGQAIYFINRIKLRLFQQYKQEMDAQKTPTKLKSPRPAPRIEPAPQPKFKDNDFLNQSIGGYADALNVAMTDLKNAPMESSAVQPAIVEPFKAGMSLLDMARMKLANSSSN